MLPHPTHDRLIALGLVGMAKAFEEQRQQPAVASFTFEERLGLLVDREAVERANKGNCILSVAFQVVRFGSTSFVRFWVRSRGRFGSGGRPGAAWG